MIIFIDKIELAGMIHKRYQYRPMVVMNLSSYRSGLFDITSLITKITPYNNSGLPTNQFVDSYDFDMQYATALCNDFDMYRCMMQMVVRSYEGYLVIVMVSHDPYRDAVMESLIKFIQQRYGHKAWIVEDIDDIMCIKEESFTPTGIRAIDDDIIRYNDLYSRGQVPALMEPLNIE